jgi:hypothetical protein
MEHVPRCNHALSRERVSPSVSQRSRYSRQVNSCYKG